MVLYDIRIFSSVRDGWVYRRGATESSACSWAEVLENAKCLVDTQGVNVSVYDERLSCVYKQQGKGSHRLLENVRIIKLRD